MEKKTNIRIVPMNADHLDQIERLERICFSRPWSRRMLAEELDHTEMLRSFTAVHIACENTVLYKHSILSLRTFVVNVDGKRYGLAESRMSVIYHSYKLACNLLAE